VGESPRSRAKPLSPHRRSSRKARPDLQQHSPAAESKRNLLKIVPLGVCEAFRGVLNKRKCIIIVCKKKRLIRDER